MNRQELLHQIESSYLKVVKSRSNLIASGPFLISWNPTTKLRWMNNAVVQDHSKAIQRDDVREMVKAFEEHDRMPRMEVFRELRPDLIDLLLSEGFEIESELPMMVCTSSSFKPQRNPEVRVQTITPACDPTPFMRIADISFEHDEPITPARIEGMRQSLRKGTQWAA